MITFGQFLFKKNSSWKSFDFTKIINFYKKKPIKYNAGNMETTVLPFEFQCFYLNVLQPYFLSERRKQVIRAMKE